MKKTKRNVLHPSSFILRFPGVLFTCLHILGSGVHAPWSCSQLDIVGNG